MYYTFGYSECLKNLFLAGGEMTSSQDEAEQNYKAFCATASGIDDLKHKPEAWISNQKLIATLIEHYIGEGGLTDLGTQFLDTPEEAQDRARQKTEQVLAEMRATDRQLANLFDLFVHSLFYWRSDESGGATVSSLPGVIWCSFRKNWELNDILEFFVHELTHTLLFVDERNHVYYKQGVEPLLDKDNWATSAILCRKRPLDKVIHSLVVATELVLFRLKHGEPKHPKAHPGTPQMIEQIKDTRRSLEEHTNLNELVTPRFYALMDQTKAAIG